MDLYVDIRAKEIVHENGRLKVVARYKNKDEEIEVIGDKVLIASGRAPVVEGLNLENLGISYDRRGIQVDDDFQTTLEGIYAIGDVNSKGIQLAHVASSQGTYVVEKIMGLEPETDFEYFPACIFTMTQVAQVGYTEEELKEKSIEYKTSKFMFGANSKAQASGETDGFIKILASEDNKILGVHILGSNAIELIHEGTLAAVNDLDASDITKAIHAHPTLSESFFEAVLGLDEKAIHLAPKRKRNKK